MAGLVQLSHWTLRGNVGKDSLGNPSWVSVAMQLVGFLDHVAYRIYSRISLYG